MDALQIARRMAELNRPKEAAQAYTLVLHQGSLAPQEELEALSAVLSLPEKYKLPIHLYYYEGYSVAEIAGILKLGQSAVKMRLKRGRELLKIELEGAT